MTVLYLPPVPVSRGHPFGANGWGRLPLPTDSLQRGSIATLDKGLGIGYDMGDKTATQREEGSRWRLSSLQLILLESGRV